LPQRLVIDKCSRSVVVWWVLARPEVGDKTSLRVRKAFSWCPRGVDDDIVESAGYNCPADAGLNVARMIPKLEVEIT